VILCDAGPLVALLDAGDPHHARCVAALDGFSTERLMTTWLCLGEAMYLAGRHVGGFPAQETLWQYVEDGLVLLDSPPESERRRLHELMRQYQVAPMDLRDASLVAAAERLGLRRVFTVDKHFRAYRIHGWEGFEIIP
jgi:uncharacterized protein